MEKLQIPNLNININHRNWIEALEEAFAYLTCSQPSEVVCIVGPSRAGKTKLIEQLKALLVGEQSIEDSGEISAVSVTAANSGPNGSFSTKSFVLRMLNELKHPMYSEIEGGNDQEGVVSHLARVPEHRLRQAAEHALIQRNVQYLFIDEAQHILHSSKRTDSAEAILDSWKCLAQDANLVLVLVGAYPLLRVIQNSPHLLGRKHQVHMPRYQPYGDDLIQFTAVLVSYEQLLGSYCLNGVLKNNKKLLYKYSLGCVGLLKLWLKRSLAIANLRKVAISKSILQETKLSNDEIEAIEKEIIAGERTLGEDQKVNKLASPTFNKTMSSKPFQAKPKRRTKNNRGNYND